MGSLFICILVLALLPWSQSFNGQVAKDFKKGDNIEVLMPYDYYSLSYCKPPVIINSTQSVGQVLRGDLIQNSVYNFKMRETEYCRVACRVKLDADSAEKLKEKINDGYVLNMILDDLPAAIFLDTSEWHGKRTNIPVDSLPVGRKGYNFEGDGRRHFIYNHLRFTILYHEDPVTNFSHIVGFEILPCRFEILFKLQSENLSLFAVSVLMLF